MTLGIGSGTIFPFWTPQRIVLITPVRSSQCEVLERALWAAENMRVYYEDSYRFGHHHHHHRPSKLLTRYLHSRTQTV